MSSFKKLAWVDRRGKEVFTTLSRAQIFDGWQQWALKKLAYAQKASRMVVGLEEQIKWETRREAYQLMLNEMHRRYYQHSNTSRAFYAYLRSLKKPKTKSATSGKL